MSSVAYSQATAATRSGLSASELRQLLQIAVAATDEQAALPTAPHRWLLTSRAGAALTARSAGAIALAVGAAGGGAGAAELLTPFDPLSDAPRGGCLCFGGSGGGGSGGGAAGAVRPSAYEAFLPLRALVDEHLLPQALSDEAAPQLWSAEYAPPRGRGPPPPSEREGRWADRLRPDYALRDVLFVGHGEGGAAAAVLALAYFLMRAGAVRGGAGGMVARRVRVSCVVFGAPSETAAGDAAFAARLRASPAYTELKNARLLRVYRVLNVVSRADATAAAAAMGGAGASELVVGRAVRIDAGSGTITFERGPAAAAPAAGGAGGGGAAAAAEVEAGGVGEEEQSLEAYQLAADALAALPQHADVAPVDAADSQPTALLAGSGGAGGRTRLNTEQKPSPHHYHRTHLGGGHAEDEPVHEADEEGEFLQRERSLTKARRLAAWQGSEAGVAKLQGAAPEEQQEAPLPGTPQP